MIIERYGAFRTTDLVASKCTSHTLYNYVKKDIFDELLVKHIRLGTGCSMTPDHFIRLWYNMQSGICTRYSWKYNRYKTEGVNAELIITDFNQSIKRMLLTVAKLVGNSRCIEVGYRSNGRWNDKPNGFPIGNVYISLKPFSNYGPTVFVSSFNTLNINQYESS